MDNTLTFKELLENQIKNYKPDWKIPSKIVAIDPGMTCGYSVFVDGELYVADVVKLDNKRGWDLIVDKMLFFNPSIVVCEDYKLYASKATAQIGSSIDTVKIIGALEFVCGREKIPMFKQMAHTAKAFCTDDKLKEWGYYKKINPHARDSIRHGCYYLLFNRDNV